MSDCIFCRIVKGDIPATKVYEDADVLAFLDIQPVNLGHTLIIPKAHYENCQATPDEAMAALMRVARRVADAALGATGAKGFNIGINCGRVAGQVIMHTHVHVMPRFEDDGLKLWGKRAISNEDMERAAAAMAAKLKS